MKGRRLLVVALLAAAVLLLPYTALAPFHPSDHEPYQRLSERPPKGFFDTDGDLLWDGFEPLYGTDIEDVDTDDDLFPDGVEVDYWLAKASEMGETGVRSSHAPLGDPDGDGLPNVLDADSDGDGLLDGWEAANGLDPASARTNPSGAPDIYQYYSSFRGDTNDRDRDYLPDGWEAAFGVDDPSADPDGDGVTNAGEYLNGTDPTGPDALYGAVPAQADSDDDNVTDAVERALGLDPRSRDTDSDGLTDGAELYEHRTDAHDPDTDDDLLLDGLEVARGTSPILADTDGDGLDDAFELSTDPLVPDTDHDLIPDGEESDAVLDTDGDGLPDMVEITSEYLAGSTDPYNPDTDGDGLLDGQEDRNRNGRRDGNNPQDRNSDWGRGGETDPTLRDTDNGGIGDQREIWAGGDPLDPGDDRTQPPPTNPPPPPGVNPPPQPRQFSMTAVAWVMIVIAIFILAMLLALLMYNTATTKEGFLEEVLEALREGERVLYDVTLTDDVREAIFQAYRTFLGVMARHGHVRDDPTTAREFARVVREAMRVDDEALHSFTVMFELARYSDHELGLADRDRALAAFAAVRASVERGAARAEGTPSKRAAAGRGSA